MSVHARVLCVYLTLSRVLLRGLAFVCIGVLVYVCKCFCSFSELAGVRRLRYLVLRIHLFYAFVSVFLCLSMCVYARARVRAGCAAVSVYL